MTGAEKNFIAIQYGKNLADAPAPSPPADAPMPGATPPTDAPTSGAAPSADAPALDGGDSSSFGNSGLYF